MFGRMRAHLGEIAPRTVHGRGIDGLRAFGLTRQKAAYCHGLAGRLLDGALDLAAVARAPDADGRAMLLAVPGLGRWSVDIYYLMALRRPDVWPRGDLALAAAMRDVKGLRTLPSAERQEKLAARWAPWRSVAARILWSHYLAARR
jgi:DNA-3-methyladenine glycosylase II